jgi:DNA-binding MarR family transcriptional regulator
VTRLLEGLERHGLVKKALCRTDGRVAYAVLTKAGRQKLAQASTSHVAALQTLFEERYTRAELATLAELLARLQTAGSAAKDGQAA